MTLETLIGELNQKLQFAPPLNAKVKLDLGDEGIVFIDGLQSPPTISDSATEEADTVLTISRDNLVKLASGSLDPTMAYMTGKLKVQGKMGYALKLASLLED